MIDNQQFPRPTQRFRIGWIVVSSIENNNLKAIRAICRYRLSCICHNTFISKYLRKTYFALALTDSNAGCERFLTNGIHKINNL